MSGSVVNHYDGMWREFRNIATPEDLFMILVAQVPIPGYRGMWMW
jgi:hypothetical protein